MTRKFVLVGPRGGVRASGVAALVDAPFGRAGDLVDAARGALRRATAEGPASGAPGIVVGAIPFSPSVPAVLYVPARVTWVKGADASDPPPSAGAAALPRVPDDSRYRAAVAEAVARIRRGDLAKVVLARAVEAVADAPIDVDALLRCVAGGNPGGYAYRVDLDGRGGLEGLDRPDYPDPHRHDSTRLGSLVGASPELLVQVTDDVVRTNPLAGSAPRSGHAALDAARRDRLARSAKDLDEHAHVVDAVRAALAPLTLALDVPAHPCVRSTRDLWHLSTSIVGRLRPGLTALDVAGALHPTPAVAGVPRARAVASIAELEPVDRAYYAGLVGWMDIRGHGEWVLALRGGLVCGERALVHAGAGIVADSDPDLEHAETAAKMQTFLRALAQVSGALRLEQGGCESSVAVPDNAARLAVTPGTRAGDGADGAEHADLVDELRLREAVGA